MLRFRKFRVSKIIITNKMKSPYTKNTLLQVVQGNRSNQNLQESIFSPTQEKLKNKKFPSLKKNKTSQTHSPRQTDTDIYDRHLTAHYLRTLHGDTGDRRAATNSTLPKVAVQCFVGQFCGYINFSASYESLCVKSPPSASCKTLAFIVIDKTDDRMTKEFLLHKERKENGNPPHIQAHLAAPMHGRPLRSQKSLHFVSAQRK